MTIGETASSSIRLSACEGIDITLLEDGKERLTIEELSVDDAAVEFAWDITRTMRPCSVSRLNIASPIYAKAALYITEDGSIWCPPLNTDGQHTIQNEGYEAVLKTENEIWEDLALPKEGEDADGAYAPPEGNITVGWWWNHLPAGGGI